MKNNLLSLPMPSDASNKNHSSSIGFNNLASESLNTLRNINSYQVLLPVFIHLTSDGVHLNAEGQMVIALIIEENLKFFNK